VQYVPTVQYGTYQYTVLYCRVHTRNRIIHRPLDLIVAPEMANSYSTIKNGDATQHGGRSLHNMRWENAEDFKESQKRMAPPTLQLQTLCVYRWTVTVPERDCHSNSLNTKKKPRAPKSLFVHTVYPKAFSSTTRLHTIFILSKCAPGPNDTHSSCTNVNALVS
jgi:hypothetical protein